MTQTGKKIGLGSLSILLFALGVVFAMSFKGRCYGDMILGFLGLKAWTNGVSGFHLTIFYSLIFFIPAFSVGYKFNTQWGAALGKKLSFAAFVIIFALILLVIICAFIECFK